MIVIAVITRDQVPLRETEPAVHQEDYTLALEQRLMHYYKITKGDKRLANKTFTSGGADKKGSAGYALYVAFSLKKNETEETEGEVTDDHTGDNSQILYTQSKKINRKRRGKTDVADSTSEATVQHSPSKKKKGYSQKTIDRYFPSINTNNN